MAHPEARDPGQVGAGSRPTGGRPPGTGSPGTGPPAPDPPDTGGTETDDDDDRDGVAEIILSPSTRLDVGEGNPEGATYQVVLGRRPNDKATVTITAGEDSGLTVNPTTLSFSRGNWRTPQAVTVTAASDADELDELVILTHTGAGGSYYNKTAELQVRTLEPCSLWCDDIPLADWDEFLLRYGYDLPVPLATVNTTFDVGDAAYRLGRLDEEPISDPGSDPGGIHAVDPAASVISLTLQKEDADGRWVASVTEEDLEGWALYVDNQRLDLPHGNSGAAGRLWWETAKAYQVFRNWNADGRVTVRLHVPDRKASELATLPARPRNLQVIAAAGVIYAIWYPAQPTEGAEITGYTLE